MTTAIATATECEVCGTPLSGGVDTFGGHEQALCFVCFMDPEPTSEKKAQTRLAALAKLRQRLEGELVDATIVEQEAQEIVDALAARMDAIDAELKGGLKCDEEPGKEPVR